MALATELQEKYPELHQWLLKRQLPQDFKPSNDRDMAAQVKANMARDECRKCQRPGAGVFRCTACKIARYCDKECQRLDWDDHKAVCALDRIAHETVKNVLASGHSDE